MLSKKTGLKVVGLSLIASAMTAAPAFAQIGGVTGSVSGTVGGTVNSTVKTDIKTPRTKVRVNAPASARVGARSRTHYHGTHYHGHYAHDHGRFGYDHIHYSDHSHKHGYASVSVVIDGTSKRQDVGPMLTYGVIVESRKRKYLGRIIGLTRTESGMVTYIVVDGVPKPIPVETLRADGDILVTSKKKKHLT